MRVRTRSAAVAAALVMLVVAASAMPVPPSPQAKKKQPPPPPSDQQQQQQGQPADQQQPQQPSGQQQPAQPPQQGGLLTKKVTLKSSQQTKNTASAGFNGVGPDGKVQEALLKANPSSGDTAKALQLSVYSVSDGDVQNFAKEGKLNAPAPKSGGQ